MAMVKKSMDGNEAAAYASYAFTEVATIYPITPSSPMANHVDEWAANGKKNLFGTSVKLMEMQAESGACGALQGAAEAGAGFGVDTNHVTILSKDGENDLGQLSKDETARRILEFCLR